MTDLTGKTILHYNIIKQVGQGGMGVVYLAEDTKLQRNVAIKFLPHQIAKNSDERKRFEIEARAAAALNHPNIATIYAIEESEDEMFIVMEYIKGRELKEVIRVKDSADTGNQLTIPDVIDYATQLAAGLRAAHKINIIHRDIKSSNIMLTDDGQIKIMDFGLAKFGKRIDGNKKAAELTKIGSTLGTGAYMSPEQARGEDVDAATDIWSFGVVLYELLTGQLPFRGDYEQALLYAVINDSFKPVSDLRNDTPEELQNIVDKTLQKKSADRFNSMDAILTRLKKAGDISVISGESVSLPAQKKKKGLYIGAAMAVFVLMIAVVVFLLPTGHDELFSRSIAVLPFENMNQDAESEYFSNGITEDIITQLSKIGDLRVISRTSSIRYKDSDKSLREIGAELNVAYILEGSIRRSAQRIRIVSQLIDSQSDKHIWAETYDREMADIFDIQTEISEKIADALKVQISPAEKQMIAQAPTKDLSAYDYYLKGREYYNTYRAADNENAIALFSRALALDPNYALALAGLGDAYAQRVWRFGYHGSWLDSSIAQSELAIRLNPNLAEGYKALGLAFEYKGWFQKAIEANNKAIELNPNLDAAIGNNGWSYYFLGESAKALEWMERSRLLDPTSSTTYSGFGFIYWSMHDYQQSEKWFKKSLELQPDYIFSLMGLRNIFIAQGKFDEAWKYAQKTFDLDPNAVPGLLALADLYLYTGEYSLAKKYYRQALAVSPRPDIATAIAFILTEQDSVEKAAPYLDRAMSRIEDKIKEGNKNHQLPFTAATIFAVRNDKENACRWLQKTVEFGMRFYNLIERDPVFHSIRNESCFREAMDQMRKLGDEQRMLTKSLALPE